MTIDQTFYKNIDKMSGKVQTSALKATHLKDFKAKKILRVNRVNAIQKCCPGKERVDERHAYVFGLKYNLAPKNCFVKYNKKCRKSRAPGCNGIPISNLFSQKFLKFLIL